MPRSIRLLAPIAVTVLFGLLVFTCDSGATDLRGSWNPTFVRPEIPVSPDVLGIAGGHLYAAEGRSSFYGPWLIYRWDDRWVEVGSADQPVTAMAEWNGGLLVAGEFTTVSGHACRRLANWDGNVWSEFGGGVVGQEIRALLVDDDTLYVGGTFSAVGGTPASNVAAWSAGQWSAMDAGVPFTVTGLGLRTGLVVASQTSTQAPDAGAALQAWDGSSWTQPFPEPPHWASVMAVTDDVLAIGYFAGDSYLYILIDEEWVEQVLENDPDRFCHIDAVATYQDGVMVAYSWSGWDDFGGRLQYWNGTEVVDLPTAQTPDGVVRSILSQPDRLLIGGEFAKVGTTTALHVAALVDGDVDVFHRPGNGFTGSAGKLEACGDLIIIGGGPLGSTGYSNLGLVADWSGYSWHSQEIYASVAGYTCVADVALFPNHTGVVWTRTIGSYSGVSYLSYFRLDEVLSTVRLPCQGISYYDGQWIKALYYDDGGAWVEGIPGGFEGGRIVEMIPCAQGLAICGSFDNCNGLARENITIWDGAYWQDLAGGLTGTVTDLLEWEGCLLAAGSFTIVQTGQPAQVAAWDGQHWEAILTGANGDVTSVVEHQGYLLAGGTFTEVDGRPIRRLAIRDTDGSWWEFGGGANLAVTSLASSTHGLWLIGDFTEVGGIEAYHVALWEGDFVSVEVSEFAATWEAEVATIAWTLSEPLGTQDKLRLERERGGVAQLVREFEAGAGGPTFSVADPDGVTGDLYRLFKCEGRGAPHLAAEATLGPRPVIAGGLRLAAPAPNPANPRTTIAYALDEPGRVSLVVYDLRGRRLRLVADEVMSAGTHEVVWDGRDSSGREAPSGTYVVRLSAGGEVRSEKVGLVR